ncbi:hypothetical protein GO730_28665 [Spirosoma sp. HMF3257]|nr:hypothetical protein [Spirosoma telluris]
MLNSPLRFSPDARRSTLYVILLSTNVILGKTRLFGDRSQSSVDNWINP